MNRHQIEILNQIKSYASTAENRVTSQAYLGNCSKTYRVTSPTLRQIARNWLNTNKTLTPASTLQVVDQLLRGDTHEEKKTGCFILGLRKPLRALVSVSQLEQWLDQLKGWAEVDALCQNIFSATEVSTDWENWEPFLLRLAQDKNINKRRASLVFLVGLTRKSKDERFHRLAKANIQSLKSEKDTLITKAISWLLRCMIKTQRADTAAFLEAHADSLPAIAVRETRTKLMLGKKT